MKKRLESELISIAHRILKLKNKSEINQLHREVQNLYETLTVLKFVEDNINIINPKMDIDVIETQLETNLQVALLDEKPLPIFGLPLIDNKLDDNSDDEEIRLNFEINDSNVEIIDDEIIESGQNEDISEIVTSKTIIFDNDYKEPIFEVKNEKNSIDLKTDNKIVSLNEKLSKGIHINLNDRIGFVKHLFDDNNEDYLRVISQLTTKISFDEATVFINEMVKPDYNNWEGKEDYQARFMDLIEKKFI